MWAKGWRQTDIAKLIGAVVQFSLQARHKSTSSPRSLRTREWTCSYRRHKLEMSGQICSPAAFAMEKGSCCLLDRNLDEIQGNSIRGSEEKSVPLQGIELHLPRHCSQYTAWDVPTHEYIPQAFYPEIKSSTHVSVHCVLCELTLFQCRIETQEICYGNRSSHDKGPIYHINN
jgi:hypothetical protein